MLKGKILVMLMIFLQSTYCVYSKGICLKCITCLSHLSGLTENGIKDICSDEDDDVHFPETNHIDSYYLSQILYMYPNQQTYHNFKGHIPCADHGCFECSAKIKQECTYMKSPTKSQWEFVYGGIFQNTSMQQERGTTTSNWQPVSTEKLVSSKGSLLQWLHILTPARNKRHTDYCCSTQQNVHMVTEPILVGGEKWFPVNFYSPSDQIRFYQVYEEVRCSPSCITRNTSRMILFTTIKEHGDYGHSFTFFNYLIFQNIKFHELSKGGHCICLG